MTSRTSASKRSILPSTLFQRGVHDCPSCGFKLPIASEACPRCQCQLESLHTFLNHEGPDLHPIMDFAELVQGKDEAIREKISFSESRFPQLKLMFCSLVCPEGTTPATIGWWALNHGNHSSAPSWTGILLVDPHSHQVTFQAGYDLEIFMNRQKLETLLAECGEWFAIEEWAGGAANFFKELHILLKQAHREACRTQKEALQKR